MNRVFGNVPDVNPELAELLRAKPGQIVNCENPKELSNKFLRHFESGATRDTDNNKYDYEAFFCPLVLERRAAYMHKHRIQPDGSLRAGDNWQKGIPLDAYAKSEARHHHQFWKLHRGYPTLDEKGNPVDLEEAICAQMFNLEGYLHEILKKKEAEGK